MLRPVGSPATRYPTQYLFPFSEPARCSAHLHRSANEPLPEYLNTVSGFDRAALGVLSVYRGTLSSCADRNPRTSSRDAIGRSAAFPTVGPVVKSAASMVITPAIQRAPRST